MTFTGKYLVAKPASVRLRTRSEKSSTDPGKTLPAVVTASSPQPSDPGVVDFRLDDVKTGRYLVMFDTGEKTYDVPGELRVVAPREARLDELKPSVIYPDTIGGTFTFKLSGQNLGIDAKDVVLVIDGEGPVQFNTSNACSAKSTGACIETNSNLPGRILIVHRLPAHQGAAQLRIRVGDGAPSNLIPVTFSMVPESYVRPITAAIIGLLAVIVGAVLLGGRRLGAGPARNLIASALLLDRQTNTYSLSKFQLLLWTGAAVFAYIYLFLCRTLVQWSPELPPIPEGLPNLLALSLGATVLSSGLTEVRGSKGAGPKNPSVADFFSTGGMVVGERFQFFVWTLISVGTFASIVIMADPSTLTALPKIPEGMLPLMGISAIGYLGGKIARKPGPIIKTLAITKVDDAAHTMTMTVQGENLSSKATVQIDDQIRRTDVVKITPKKQDDGTSDLCIEVEIELKEADTFTVGSHSLKISNPDGQMAVANFPMDAMTIQPPAGGFTAKAGVDEAELEISGANFNEKVTAKWKPLGGDPSPATVSFVNATTLRVKFKPGIGGKGQLVLTSGAGLKATADVLVA